MTLNRKGGMMPALEIVGIPEIADRLGVPRPTLDTWRRRGELPEPGYMIGNRPAWRWSVIRTWALRTGANRKPLT